MAEYDEDEFNVGAAEQVQAEVKHRASVAADAVEAHVRRSRLAYTRLFSGKGDAADAEFVLKDLAWFASVYETTFDVQNPRVQEHKEGRRSVFLRIQEYAKLDQATLLKRYFNQQYK